MKTQEIISRSVRSENYNSNNDWGFGGKSGKMYHFEDPDLKFFKGRFDYRHAPSERVELYYYQGRSIEKVEFLEVLETEVKS